MSESNPVMGVVTTQVDGDVAIGRNVAIGGTAKVQSDATFRGNVRINGWLDAPNLKGPLKGLFSSAAVLIKTYPFPEPGWFALVGDNLPAEIYRSIGGNWVPTGKQGGEFSVYVDNLEVRVNDAEQNIIALSLRLNTAEGKLELLEATAIVYEKLITTAVTNIELLQTTVSEHEERITAVEDEISDIIGSLSTVSNTVMHFGSIIEGETPIISNSIISDVSAGDIHYFAELDMFAPYADSEHTSIYTRWYALSGSYKDYNNESNVASNKFFIDANGKAYIRGYDETNIGNPYRGLVNFGSSNGDGIIDLSAYLTKVEAQNTYTTKEEADFLTDFGYY